MTAFDNATNQRRATPGYLLTLSAGCVGMTFLGIGLGGGLIGRAGGDPFDVMDRVAVIMMVLSFALGFAMRLIFWPQAAAPLRKGVRTVISLVFLTCIPASIISLIIALTLPASTQDASLPMYFSILALLCQIGSILWLARYRQEGL